MQKSTMPDSLIICKVCNFLARDERDVEKIISDGSCYECYNNFRFIYGKDWDLGKRPTMKEARQKMRIITKRGKNG